jgi:hypothetical protein
MVTLGACACACAPPVTSPAGAARAEPPAIIDAAPAALHLTLVRGVEQAVPGTDVRVTLVRTVPYQPSIHERNTIVEPVWPSAWLQVRHDDQTEQVEWRRGWTAWRGRRWRVELDGDGAVLAVEPLP